MGVMGELRLDPVLLLYVERGVIMYGWVKVEVVVYRATSLVLVWPVVSVVLNSSATCGAKAKLEPRMLN